MLLSRDAILSADDLKYEDVPCPEWGKGAKVRVRCMTGEERDAFENETISGKVNPDGSRERNLENFRARLIVATAVDKAGAKLFAPEDLPVLGRKSAKPLDRLYTAALKLSGIGRDDVEELVKNSGAAQDGGSS